MGATRRVCQVYAHQGADGVLVSGCHPGDCHYMAGNFHARRRFAAFRKLLEFVGVDLNRLQFSWVSAAEGGKWVEVVTELIEQDPKFALKLLAGENPASLPITTPQKLTLHVNLNTADVDVLWAAIDGLDTASAQKIVQARQARHFRGLTDVTNQLGANIALNADDHAIASRYFEVRGRLRLGATMVDERSLVSRQGTIITTLWRERGAFDRAPLTAAPESGR